VYYRTGGWQNGHDEEKIVYATSLLSNNAGTWITPYAEKRIPPAWDNWAGFKAGLQRHFGVIDAKGEARIKLRNMKQGKRSVTEYRKEFRLVLSEVELDDSTGGELLLGGMIAELKNAWGASREEYEDLENPSPMGNYEGDQVSKGHAYPRISTDKKRPTRINHTTKPGLNIPTLK